MTIARAKFGELREKKLLPVKIMRKITRGTTWQISKSNITGYFFLQKKKYCAVKSFSDGNFFPGLILNTKKPKKNPCQTFAHFRQFVRQKHWSGPPSPPPLSQ